MITLKVRVLLNRAISAPSDSIEQRDEPFNIPNMRTWVSPSLILGKELNGRWEQEANISLLRERLTPKPVQPPDRGIGPDPSASPVVLRVPPQDSPIFDPFNAPWGVFYDSYREQYGVPFLILCRINKMRGACQARKP